MNEKTIKAPSKMNSELIKVNKWFVSDNSSVTKGQLIVELESGDFILEIESEYEGIIEIIKKDGSLIDVNEILCKIKI